MKKVFKLTEKGFTLIELLAVIIILAVVALIATPIILDVIEEAEKSADMSQANLLLTGAEYLYTTSILDENLKFNENTNIYSLIDTNSIKPPNGKAFITPDGKIAIAVYINGLCYEKTADEEKMMAHEVETAEDCAPKVEEEEIVNKHNCEFMDSYIDASTKILQSDLQTEYTIGIKTKIGRGLQSQKNDMGIFGSGTDSNQINLSFVDKTTTLSESIDYTPYYDQWVDIVVTYNSVTKQQKTYINGELKETLENITKTITSTFYIGNNSNSKLTAFSGELSTIRIWKKEIIEEDVAKINLVLNPQVNMEDIYLDTNLESKAKMDDLGTVNGSYYCYNSPDTNPFPETFMKFTGNTRIATDVNQSEIVNNFTIALKVNINRAEQATVSYMGLFGNHTGGTGISMQFITTTADLFAYVDYTPYYDKWVDLVYTYDKATTDRKLYIDGELKVTSKHSIPAYSGFYVGTSFSSGRYAKMHISQMRIWDKTFTEEEVNQIDLYSKEPVVAVDDVYRNMNFESLESIQEFGTFQGTGYYFNE